MPEKRASRLPSSTDIVIVGAGAAGLYCAYRLLKDDPKRKVIVLDRLDRIGGRLDTDLVRIKSLASLDPDGKTKPGKVVEVKEEEGGMRFNQSMQELLALLWDLRMWDQLVWFGMGNDNNYYHIRGRSFTKGDSLLNNNAIWSELYNLAPNERNKSPVDIITAIYNDLVEKNGEIPPTYPTEEFWQRFRLDFKYQGIPLNHWGLWSLYRAYGLSEECINMMADTVGFAGPFFSLVSAGEAYQILEDFPANPVFASLRDGYESLPKTMADWLASKGVPICLSSLVTSVDKKDKGFRIEVAQGKRPHRIDCRKLILALPATALQELMNASPALNAEKNPRHAELQRDIDSVVPMRLCKINLYYREAWWRDNGPNARPDVTDGGSFTTLPLGSVYAFDPLAGESSTGPAALTIYCDFNNTNFWEQLQATGPMFTSPLQEEHDRTVPQVLFPASERIVEEATRQIADLFQVVAVPRPVLTSFRLWSGEHQFGYAYHQWARFADDREVIKSVASPAENVYVCNEAFSDDQGWVNGSLRSANNVLGTYFGIAPLPPQPPDKKLPGPPAS